MLIHCTTQSDIEALNPIDKNVLANWLDDLPDRATIFVDHGKFWARWTEGS